MFWDVTVGDVVGGGLAIGGFGLTLWQLSRTRRAAEAARAAVATRMAKDARERTVADLALAGGRLADGLAALGEGRWSEARAAIQVASVTFAGMSGRPTSAPRRADLQRAIALLEAVESELSRPRPRSVIVPDLLTQTSEVLRTAVRWSEQLAFTLDAEES